jgi:5'-nucleotidase (lipoprotein e(P4) family)
MKFFSHIFSHTFVVMSGIALIGCVSTNTTRGDAQNYNRDLVMGILWQQQSGEYAALCYQAFNAGKQYINALPGNHTGEKRAVVLDIDETILDNSKYAAWMVASGEPWSNEAWESWCNALDAYPIPGSLDFTLFLQKNSIEVFYVSNRPVSVTNSTITNMQSLGFPFADAEHVLLMEKTSDKTPRIERIQQQGFTVVLYAGDNLDDFDSSIRKQMNQERRAWADARIGQFGAYWIVLPNAVYGTFESAIRPNYYGLSPKERASARSEALNFWEP